jgi:tetratricopeptide (TPR) repeat protein
VEKTSGNEVINFPTGKDIPFEGELRNFAGDLQAKGLYKEAASVLETTIKLYPDASASYSTLSVLYRKLGKPVPVDEMTFMQVLRDGNIDEALATYEKEHKSFPGWRIFKEEEVNNYGYELLRKKEFARAIRVFQLNTKAFPNSSNAFDSLGEGYMLAGNRKEAIANYHKSLELNPGNDNARKMLADLEGKI